jgi:hypothetical protein
MNYKIKGAVDNNKGNLIIFTILWLAIVIFIVGPISHSWHIASQGGSLDMGIFIKGLVQDISQPQQTIIDVFADGAGGTFFKIVGGITLVFGLFFLTGMAKTAPKNEYTDIEHGSSDWSRNGEQYKILNKKERNNISRRQLFTCR